MVPNFSFVFAPISACFYNYKLVTFKEKRTKKQIYFCISFSAIWIRAFFFTWKMRTLYWCKTRAKEMGVMERTPRVTSWIKFSIPFSFSLIPPLFPSYLIQVLFIRRYCVHFYQKLSKKSWIKWNRSI